MIYSGCYKPVVGQQLSVFSYDGKIDPEKWTLKRNGSSGAGNKLEWTPLAVRGLQSWDHPYQHAVIIPTGTQPGLYTLQQPDGRALPLEIVSTANRHYVENKIFYGPHIEDFSKVDKPVTFRYCQFYDVDLSLGGIPNAVVENCIFIRSSIIAAHHGHTILRCTFIGMTKWGMPIEIRSVPGVHKAGVAVIDCDFDGTQCGPWIRAAFEDISGMLISGCDLTCIHWQHNGCEGIGLEGIYKASDLLILHTRYSGASHATTIWDVPCDRVLMRDYRSDGQGICVFARPEFTQRSRLEDAELIGGHVWARTKDDIICKNVSVVAPIPSKGSLWNAETPVKPDPIIPIDLIGINVLSETKEALITGDAPSSFELFVEAKKKAKPVKKFPDEM